MHFELLQNSLVLATVATVLAVVFAWPVAVASQCRGPVARRWIRGACLATLALPGFFVAGMWMEWLGFAGAWRVAGGGSSDRWMPILVAAAVLAAQLWPVGVLAWTGIWDRWDARLLESEPRLRGARLMARVVLPISASTCRAPVIVIAILAATNFAVPALFQARVWPVEIWMEYSTRFDARAAWSKSWPLLVWVAVLLAWGWRLRWSWPATGTETRAEVWRERLGRGWGTGLDVAAVAVFAVGWMVPMGTALASTRTWTELGPALGAAWPAAVRSVAISAVVATVVLLVATGCAGSRAMAGTAALFVLPGVFTGMLCAELAGGPAWDGFRDGGGLTVLALAARYAFVGWWLARRHWVAESGQRREWVALAGGNRWAVWRHGVLAGQRGRLAGAWGLVYLLALWDVETQILVVPPGGDTLGLMIFNLLHYGRNGQVNALCVLLGAVAALPWAVGWWVASARRRGVAEVVLLAGLAVAGAGCGAGSGDGPSTDLRSGLFERVEIIGRKGTGPGLFSKPRSVAVDDRGHLFAVDMTGRVQRFDAAGRWELSWQMPETVLGRPKGMAAGSGEGVWLVEPHYHRINRFDADGHLLRQWGEHGEGTGKLWFPRAIAPGPDGVCYVSEYGRVERIQKFRVDTGEYLGGFGEAGTGPGQLNRAEGLTVGPGGEVYVADSCNHRVQVFSSDGRFLRQHGRAGSGPGEMSYPYDVRVDAEGRQYVCEFGNSRIQVFGPDDRSIEILGRPGSGATDLNNPWSLCLDGAGNLYVADALNHRVVKYVRRRGMAEGRNGPRPAAEGRG